MLAYKDVSLIYNGVRIDPENYIESKEQLSYHYVEEGKRAKEAQALFIRWKQAIECKEYICGNSLSDLL